MHRTTLTSCLSIAALALARQNSSAGLVTIPVHTEGGFVFGNFGLGDSKNLSLVIGTISDLTFTNPGVYKKTQNATNNRTMVDVSYYALWGRECASAEVNYMAYTDVMTAEGLEVQDVQFARLFQNETTNNGNKTGVPHAGMIGLSGPYKDSGSDTFIQNVCLQGKLAECRIGLALNTAGAGSLILGGLKENELENKRTATNFSRNNGFIVGGEVVYSLAGKRHTFQNQSLLTASETADVVGPIHQVRNILGGMNATIVETSDSCGKMLFGTYPCNATPPEFGFSFKDERPDANGGLVWPFDASAWRLAREGGSCTAPIVGWEGIGNSTWYLGQAWLRGKYLDFDLDNTTVTVANLTDIGGSVGGGGGGVGGGGTELEML